MVTQRHTRLDFAFALAFLAWCALRILADPYSIQNLL